jgi:hypothetical protein
VLTKFQEELFEAAHQSALRHGELMTAEGFDAINITQVKSLEAQSQLLKLLERAVDINDKKCRNDCWYCAGDDDE